MISSPAVPGSLPTSRLASRNARLSNGPAGQIPWSRDPAGLEILDRGLDAPFEHLDHALLSRRCCHTAGSLRNRSPLGRLLLPPPERVGLRLDLLQARQVLADVQCSFGDLILVGAVVDLLRSAISSSSLTRVNETRSPGFIRIGFSLNAGLRCCAS